MNDVVLNKIQSIQRCVRRAREEFAADPDSFDKNFTRQDAAVLNILRACEQAIDLANHVIKTRKLGIPTSSGESFDLLAVEKVIDSELNAKLQKMVGFRNAIVHHYQRMDLEIVRSVIAVGLNDLIDLGDRVLAYMETPDG
ncbi:conserved protein of unknown function [Candidatus Promineifilum breve]|uniref:Toxin-antitoxin antitoxin component n=1 Tax=Candidatus Promineifilum breve TaxID=1806508 RepID=A0A160T4P6_9CHLR|nr:DUF86 domain-containing protein [Candidatus Promineifilum breve]CUS04068.2 conserved protein of unknown function [Candidatus Promineifilum breve]